MSTVSPAAFRKIVKELNELKKNPPEGIRVQINEENMLDFTAMIQGPEETPYAGGYFKIKFAFTNEFPTAPPKCWFTTKIFHPNVSASGEICVNTLKKDWQPSYGISHILVTVKCLLIYPNPESALDEEAGKLLLENYDDYGQRAKLITSVHAKVRPQEFDTPSCSESTSPSTSTKPVAAANSQNTPELNGTPLLSIPSTATPASKTAPTTTQPLQTSPNNVPTTISTTAVTSAKDKPRDRHPSPLGTADSNIAANKAVKRSATAGIGAEKRKKALKRL